jgi:DNA polymerase-3 subunit beta
MNNNIDEWKLSVQKNERFQFGNNWVNYLDKLNTEDIEMANEATEKINCEYDGEDMEIGFNARFLKEMLSTMDGENVQLKMSQPNRAGLLVPAENEKNEEITMLIMPMMLNNY